MRNLICYFFPKVKNNASLVFVEDNEKSFNYSQSESLIKKGISFFVKNNIVKERIILFANRNADTYLAILSIIGANNSYIPVNPELNEDKVASIIKTSHAKYQLYFKEEEKIAGLIHIAYNDLLNEQYNEEAFLKSIEQYDENNELSIIYTSGSTGAPKGVSKSQGAMIAFLENFKETFNIRLPLRIANQAPLFFDASSKDLFLNLFYGGSLYFPDKTDFALPNRVIDYLNAKEINYICWVPSAYVVIARLKTLNFVLPKYLKYAFFVGEVLPRKYLNYWMEKLPDVYYCNLFGSSEIAGICLYNHIENIESEDKSIPLGKPIKNNEVYLQGEEIIVKSKQIANGYVNDDADNSIFFKDEEGNRCLRTGDLGYLDENGDLHFTSRKDFQIKHMGYRIELQEIEGAIIALPFINQACCLFDNIKDKVIAVVSLLEEIIEPEKTLLKELKNKLPGYLIPNRIIVMDNLPLNDNGKINRTLLRKECLA
ncbi:MAG: AMP-binding protein [Bacilli bacterium]|nr:AMP-binding protein [Bacilli bacterium]